MAATPTPNRLDDALPALLGALVVGVGWGMDLAIREYGWSIGGLIQLHLENPLHWLVDLFPFYLVWAHRQLRRHRQYYGEVVALRRALGVEQAGRARTRQLAAAIFDGLLITREDGTVVACNPAAEVLFGLNGEEMAGTRVRELLLGLETAPESAQIPRKSSRQEVLAIEKHIQGMHKSGQRFPCAVTSAPIDTSGGRGVLYTVRDLGAQMSSAATRLNIEVDPKVFEPQPPALIEPTASDKWLAARIQELRAPLAGILGQAADVRTKLGEGSESEPDLTRIEATGHALLVRLSNVVDRRLMDQGELELHVETVPVESVLLDAVDACRSIVRANGNTVTTQLPESDSTCEVDQRRARDILVNLIVNASQHTEGGHIEVRARRDDKGDFYEVVFEVSDTGTGMNTQALDEVIYAPDPESASIGLQLCRELAKQMSGELNLMSIQGQGTTASLRVPSKDKPTLVPARSRRWAPPKKDLPGRRDRTAMIVGAPTIHSAIIREALEEHRWNIVEERAHTALDAIRENRPDLLIFGFDEPQRTWHVWLEVKRHPILGLLPAMCVDTGEHARRAWITRLAAAPLDGEAISSMAGHLHASRIVPRALLLEHDVMRRAQMGAILRGAGWWVFDPPTTDIALELAAELPPELLVLGGDYGEDSTLSEVLSVIRGVPATRKLPLILMPGRDLAEEERTRAERAGCEIIGKHDPHDLLVVHATIALSAAHEAEDGAEEPAGDA